MLVVTLSSAEEVAILGYCRNGESPTDALHRFLAPLVEETSERTLQVIAAYYRALPVATRLDPAALAQVIADGLAPSKAVPPVTP